MKVMRRNLVVLTWVTVAVAGLFVLARLATALPVAADTVMVVQTVTATMTPTPPPAGTIANPSFETGDLTGWVAEDLDDPYMPMHVDVAGVGVGDLDIVGAPTDGTYAFYTGFDGCGPGVIRLMQDLTLPLGRPILLFDYRAAWDITWGEGPALQPCKELVKLQDRHFYVVIEESGGGKELARFLILTAPGGEPLVHFNTGYTPTEPDTGNLLGTVDLSAFAGQGIRLVFERGPPFSSWITSAWNREGSDREVTSR